MTAPTDAQALLAWMDDAHAAVDLGHVLSPAMVLALMATPTQAAKGGRAPAGAARTWFLEEYETMMRRQLRDPVPFGGTEADVQAWRDRQDRISADLAELAHMHAVCLGHARAFVRGQATAALGTGATAAAARGKAKGRTTRRTAASVALDAIGEAA